MNIRATRIVAASLTLWALLAFALVSGAAASHYDLVDVPFVTDAERTALAKLDISATDHLISKIGKKAPRAEAAKTSGLDAARLLELARTCDLLRVKGLGPRMVKLFAAGGIFSIQQLRKQEAVALNRHLQAVNDEKHVAGLVPPAELIAAWIKQAQAMPLLLEE